MAEKRVVRKRTKKTEAKEAETNENLPKTSFIKKIPRTNLILVLFLVLIIGLLFIFRSLFIAAIVNNQPVSRISILRFLEKQSGKQALNSIITKTLIFQEAKKKNISISQEEISSEIKKIDENLKKQGQSLDQALALQSMTKKDLEEQIVLQKMLQKMVGEIKVSDKETAEFIEQNKESFPEGTTDTQIKETAVNQLKQQKTEEKIQSFINELQKKAKINYLVQY